MPTADEKIDTLLGLVRVIADDQVSIRAKLASLEEKLDGFIAEYTVAKYRKVVSLQASGKNGGEEE